MPDDITQKYCKGYEVVKVATKYSHTIIEFSN